MNIVKKLYEKYGMTHDYKRIIRFEENKTILTVTFNVKSNIFMFKNAFEQVEKIFNRTINYSTILDDITVWMYICKSLAICTNGDCFLEGETIIFKFGCQVIELGLHDTVDTNNVIIDTNNVIIDTNNVIIDNYGANVDNNNNIETIVSEKQSKKVILLVEDNVILQKMFVKWNSSTYDVTIATNGQEAILKFKQRKYDIVFMDIELPYTSGIEVTKEIRLYERQNKKNTTPIIGVSGIEKYKNEALQSGMDDYVLKGQNFMLKSFQDMIEKYTSSVK